MAHPLSLQIRNGITIQNQLEEFLKSVCRIRILLHPEMSIAMNLSESQVAKLSELVNGYENSDIHYHVLSQLESGCSAEIERLASAIADSLSLILTRHQLLTWNRIAG